MANSTEQWVRAAKNPQEALVAIALALDRIEAGLVVRAEAVSWLQDWNESGEVSSSPPSVTAFMNEMADARTELDGEDIVIPGPSDAKMERRIDFEGKYLKLHEYLEGDEDWTEAYAKGGPRWLYYGNRDLVMSYPEWTRQQMIMDIEEDSPEEAHEIGRDLLKQPCETGPGGMGMHIDESIAPARGGN